MSTDRKQIGAYRVLRVLGVGGMGTVYEAEHQKISRRVAVKLLHGEFAQNPELVQRFLNEARAVNEIKHQGVIQIFDADTLEDGTPFLVMELLSGHTLAEYLLRKRTMQMVVMLDIGEQLAESLRAAHSRLIVHRDLKPDNIMLLPDLQRISGLRAKILDFGIAKLTLALGGGKTVADYLGTPTYSSPEQIQNPATVDAKADVYSLGCILYECAAGMPPFEAPTQLGMMMQQLHSQPRRLNEITGHIGIELADLIEEMLHKDRTKRPNMEQVIAVLREVKQRCGENTVMAVQPKQQPPLPLTVIGSQEPILPDDPSIGFDRAALQESMRTSKELIAAVMGQIGRRWRWMTAGGGMMALVLISVLGVVRGTTRKPTPQAPPPIESHARQPSQICQLEIELETATIHLPNGQIVPSRRAVFIREPKSPALSVEIRAPDHQPLSVAIDDDCQTPKRVSLVSRLPQLTRPTAIHRSRKSPVLSAKSPVVVD